MGILGKSKPVDFGTVSSILGEDASFRGEISTRGSIRIGGEFEGKVNAEGDVFVGEGSKVTGNIIGSRVIVSGEINGNIVSTAGLEITKTGKVFGDVTSNKLIVDEGAIYKGKVNMEISLGRKTPEIEAESYTIQKSMV